jgi:hypothetical protein
MQNQHLFFTAQFGLSPEGIHLLRNGYNHTTVVFKDITDIEVRSGMEMKNWIWVLIVGIVLAGYGLLDIAKVFNIFNDSSTTRIHIERIVVPLFPLLLGIYSIVIAFRKTKVMIVKTNDKSYYLSLREIIKSNQLNYFLDELGKLHRVRLF